jgi:hypothetical protein
MRRLVVVLGVVLGSRAHAGTCVVHGSSVTLQSVTVTPPAPDSPFQLGVRGLPVEAVLPARCGARLELHVGGSIMFTAMRDNVWLRVTREVTSADGMVTLEPGAQVIDACMQGDTVVASAVMYSDDVLEGEPKPAGEVVTGVDVPCDALTLDAVELADPFLSGPLTPGGTDHDWELRGGASRVQLRAQPRRRAASHVVESPAYLRELKRKGSWVFVEDAGEGVRITGWVPVAMLRRIPDDVGIGRSYGCWGDHAGGGWGEGPVIGAIESDGTIKAGSSVFASAGASAPWGIVTKAERVRVRIQSGSTWAELRRIPGLDGDPPGSPWLNGVVRLDAVNLAPKP